MENRANPETFATYSYYLAYATAGIMLVGFVMGLLDVPGAFLIWMALITSAVGTFMAWAARKDLQVVEASDDIKRMARIGWRVNSGALIVMVIMLIMALVVYVLVMAAPFAGGQG